MTRRRHPRSGDAGFTAVELVVSIAVMGLIAVPLFLTLSGAIRLAPESGARAARAADRGFLADAFSRDTTNAAAVALTDSSGAGVDRLTLDCAEVALPTALRLTVTEVGGNDHTAAQSEVVYGVTITGAAAGVATRAVQITRTEGGTTREVTVGACTGGDTRVVGFAVANTQAGDPCGTPPCWLAHENVDLRLRIRPRANDPVEVVDFKGAFGRTLAQPA